GSRTTMMRKGIVLTNFTQDSTAYAKNSCGFIGGQHAGSSVTLASSEVYSIYRVHGDCVDCGHSFNFANLLPTLLYSAFNTAVDNDACNPPTDMPYPNWFNGDYVNGERLDYTQPCSRIIDWAYRLTLVVPTQIRNQSIATPASDAPAPSKASTVPVVISILTGPLNSAKSNPAAQTAAAPDPKTGSDGHSAAGSAGQSTGAAVASTASSGDPSDPKSASSIVSVGVSAFTVGATTNSAGSVQVIVAGRGSTAMLSAGQTTLLGGGQVISAASSGGVVIGTGSTATTVTLGQPGSVSRARSAVAIVGSSTFTIVAKTNSAGSSEVTVAGGGSTATLDTGETTSLAGQVISALSSGGAVIGTGSSATTIAPGPHPAGESASGAILTLEGSSTLSVLETVNTGSDGQKTTEAVVDGSTITPGNPTTIDGHTISLASDGVVVDGTQTQTLSALFTAVYEPLHIQ
ncbi:hypothetical protein LTS16_026799, partial [Friedmanniomyces endolithicus]